MDKLLKICALFECTLDELVVGDLTKRPLPTEPATTPEPTQDVCGYDEHMRSFARCISGGVALIMGGVTAGTLVMGIYDTLYRGVTAAGEILIAALLLLGVAAGVALIISSALKHSSFKREHPFVEDFYPLADKMAARSTLGRALGIGIGLILLSALVSFATEYTSVEDLAPGISMALVSIAVWMFVYFGMMSGRTNVSEYNKETAEDLEVEEIISARLDDEKKELLLQQKRASRKQNALCGAVMLTATAIALILLFVPIGLSESGDPFPFFWLPWPIGGLGCGVIKLLMDAFAKNE